MFRLSRSTAWTWVLLTAVLFARLGDAHVHLCFDGQEPPTTMHVMEDAAHHDGDDAGVSGHNDQDVNLFDAVLAKKAGAADFLLLAVTIVALLLPRQPVRQKIFFAPVQTVASLPLFFHPPLRGPPL